MDSQPSNFYALAQLETKAKLLITLAEILPVYRERMQKQLQKSKAKARDIYDLILKEKRNIIQTMGEITHCLNEIEENDLAKAALHLSSQIAKFNVMTPDYTKFSGVLIKFAKHLPTSKTTNASIIGRLMNNVKMGYYPTDLSHVELISQRLSFPTEQVSNIFDPCCGEGLALRTLATGNNCYTYGIELDEGRAEQAQERLHRVGFGSFFHSHISHDAFHLMLLNPPYISVLNENGGKSRHEKRFLVESYNRLIKGGVLVYIIPYYRLTSDIIQVLQDNFTDISVYRFLPDEFAKFKQIAVFGVRKQRDYTEKLDENLLAMSYDYTKIPEITELAEGQYSIPNTATEVSIFKGTVFNVAELARQLEKSNSISKLLATSTLDSTEKRPLLPLNVGQVGLIGGSGLINGLAECDTPHIIKGRVIKQKTSEETVSKTDNYGRAIASEITVTTSNKLIFNILTPKGFKSLN